MFWFVRRLALAIPIKDGAFEKCRQYDVNFTQFVEEGVTQADPSWPTVPCKNGWEFNLTEVPYESIAAEVSGIKGETGSRAKLGQGRKSKTRSFYIL